MQGNAPSPDHSSESSSFASQLSGIDLLDPGYESDSLVVHEQLCILERIRWELG